MALINCPECGKRISEFAKSCPNCGCPASEFAAQDYTDYSDYPLSNDNDIEPEDPPDPEIPEPWTEKDYRDYFGVPDDVPFSIDDYFDD